VPGWASLPGLDRDDSPPAPDGAEYTSLSRGHAPQIRVPYFLAAAAAWSWRILLTGAALAVLVWVLAQVYVVVVPVVVALFVAAVLEPLVARLRRLGWRPSLAAATVFLAALAALGLLVWWIGTNVADQFEDVGREVEEGVDEVKQWLQGEPLNLSAERIEQLQDELARSLQPGTTGLSAQVANRARAASEVFGGIVLFLFTLFFVLKDGYWLADWFRDRIRPAYRPDAVALVGSARRIMRQYLVATALTGFIDGLLIGIALAVLGVPLVLPLAVLTFLGGFFPIVGATLAGLVAALVALVSGGLVKALVVVGVTIAVQQIEGNLLQPLILERAVRLHPLVTVWAVGAGLLVAGLLGAFLFVPLVAIAAAWVSYYRTRDDPPPPGESVQTTTP
jgi:predicted PurR-regulated permease PerM